MTSAVADATTLSDASRSRADELFRLHQQEIFVRTDRMFAWLMLGQWLAGIAAAIWISPRTWIGTQSQVHVHVWAALLLGGILTCLPVILAVKQPGRPLTRHSIAIGQMLTSALLIHLTGGRIETHFHIFGSLAFLAVYRDWRVLATATAVVALDHAARGIYWPQSVFGVLTSSPWRWVEHAGWVIFEDIFLIISNHESLKGMRLVAERQARLEYINQDIERVVEERTSQLEDSHQKLVAASRQAGMAEVATSVLHNVGNVLNSVNVSVSVISDKLRKSKIESVGRASGLLEQNASKLGDFITKDPKGSQLPNYLKQLAGQLETERTAMLDEVAHMAKSVDHIKDIVAMQQNYAKVSGVTETLPATELVEDAIRMNASLLVRNDIQLCREFQDPSPEVTVEKHKALQILVNLIRNAKQSCDESGHPKKRLTVRVNNGGEFVRISIIDNGVGVAPENLVRIFNHGFTTKKSGHGFGLHSGALAARELGGALLVDSDGPGRGATFTLELPCAAVPAGV